MILAISYAEEEHTADVLQRLAKQGRDVLLIDLADFPSRAGMACSWVQEQPSTYEVATPSGRYDLGAVRAGWWRRVRPFTVDTAVQAPHARAFAESETSQALAGVLDALPCAWVNPRTANDAAEHKPYQWAVARSAGLRLPRTLVTNEPEAARRFIGEVGVGKTIFKAFLASHEAWRETRLLKREDLDQLDSVRYAPVIFQEYVEGVDLRITVVGRRVFAASIDARATSYPVDMRMVVGESVVRPAVLPPSIEAALLELQSRLGLEYGAIDMRRTPEGQYVFFEVNPAGQWLFVEQRTELPISQAVADHLAWLESGPGAGEVTVETGRGRSGHSP